MKISDPQAVIVTDDLRAWCAAKWGAQYLPDLYLQEFKDSCAARGTKYKDAERAFRNWINWSSPGGRFYHPVAWERRFAQAKTIGVSKRLAQAPTYTPRGYVMPANERSAADVARGVIAKLRAQVTR